LLSAGVYSVVGFEVTPSTIVGLLTILGFSLYDTVVVFDKVVENTRGILGSTRQTYSEAANLAVNQTLMRSINTSLIALLPVGGLLFVGAGLLGVGTLKTWRWCCSSASPPVRTPRSSSPPRSCGPQGARAAVHRAAQAGAGQAGRRAGQVGHQGQGQRGRVGGGRTSTVDDDGTATEPATKAEAVGVASSTPRPGARPQARRPQTRKKGGRPQAKRRR